MRPSAHVQVVPKMGDAAKKIDLPMKGGQFNELLRKIARLLVEKEPDTSANQVLL